MNKKFKFRFRYQLPINWQRCHYDHKIKIGSLQINAICHELLDFIEPVGPDNDVFFIIESHLNCINDPFIIATDGERYVQLRKITFNNNQYYYKKVLDRSAGSHRLNKLQVSELIYDYTKTL